MESRLCYVALLSTICNESCYVTTYPSRYAFSIVPKWSLYTEVGKFISILSRGEDSVLLTGETMLTAVATNGLFSTTIDSAFFFTISGAGGA